MEVSFDEQIEKIFGKNPVKEDEKYVPSKDLLELYEAFVGSKEDIEKERVRREERMRINLLNSLEEDYEYRKHWEKAGPAV